MYHINCHIQSEICTRQRLRNSAYSLRQYYPNYLHATLSPIHTYLYNSSISTFHHYSTLPIDLSTLSIYLSTPSIHLYTLSIYLPYLSIYLSTLSIYLSTLSIYPPYLSIYLPYLSIHPIYLSTLSIYPPCLPYHEYKVRHCW